MSETMCRYAGERDQALVAFLYDEIDPVERADFEGHLATCARCRGELASLRAVRPALRRWTPPEPARPFVVVPSDEAAARRTVKSWLRGLPVWTQAAAAMLVLGVSAGAANLDVHYDRNGLSVRTGWSRAVRGGPAGTSGVLDQEAASASRWRADLAALETRLRSEIRATPAVAAPASRPVSDVELVRRVRALIDESERRQQRELALRLADVMRDVDAQRRADLSKIDRNLGLIQNNTGVEVMKQRELLNYLVRVSQNR
jgi:hypothetical protein